MGTSHLSTNSMKFLQLIRGDSTSNLMKFLLMSVMLWVRSFLLGFQQRLTMNPDSKGTSLLKRVPPVTQNFRSTHTCPGGHALSPGSPFTTIQTIFPSISFLEIILLFIYLF